MSWRSDAGRVVIGAILFLIGLYLAGVELFHMTKGREFHPMTFAWAGGFLLVGYATLLPMTLKESGTVAVDLVRRAMPWRRGTGQHPTPPPDGPGV